MTSKSPGRKQRDLMAKVPPGYTSFSPVDAEWVCLVGEGKPNLYLNIRTGALGTPPGIMASGPGGVH